MLDLPVESKQAMAMSKSGGMSKTGYKPICSRISHAKSDTKEGFYVGIGITSGDLRTSLFRRPRIMARFARISLSGANNGMPCMSSNVTRNLVGSSDDRTVRQSGNCEWLR